MTWFVRHAKLLLGVYVVFLLFALFSPTSGDQSNAVKWLGTVLDGLGVPDRLTTFDRLEVLANVLIIAPVTLLGSGIWPSHTWRDWTAFGFVAASMVELFQGLVLPERQASFSDIVANTAGALFGALLAILVVRGLRLRAARRIAEREGAGRPTEPRRS